MRTSRRSTSSSPERPPSAATCRQSAAAARRAPFTAAVFFYDDGDIEQAFVSESTIDKYHPLLPPNRNYQSRRIMLESFSSLQRKLYHGPEEPPQETGFQVIRQKDKEDDERFTVFDSDNIRTVRLDDEIPGGADIGSMFHDIFEHIDFEAAAKNPDDLLARKETGDVIVKTMDAYRVDGRWRPQVCRIVANTLVTPVSACIFGTEATL